MSTYVISHVPHAKTECPSHMAFTQAEQDRARMEIRVVTDWFTDELLTEADEQIIFPFSRVYCDVERFVDDPLNDVGQGVFYEKTLDGRPLRHENLQAKAAAIHLYRGHHDWLKQSISMTLPISPVLLIDMHSYSDFQAGFTGKHARPDICLGTDPDHTAGWMVDEARAVFERHGYTVDVNLPYSGTIVPTGMRGYSDLTAMMFEVNKRLYLNADLTKNPRGFARLQLALNEATAMIKSN